MQIKKRAARTTTEMFQGDPKKWRTGWDLVIVQWLLVSGVVGEMKGEGFFFVVYFNTLIAWFICLLDIIRLIMTNYTLTLLYKMANLI